MNLILDIGNSQQKCAVFSGDEILFVQLMQKINISDIEKIFAAHEIKKSIISSVGETNDELEKLISEKTNSIIFSHQTPIPIKNLYTTPETLGKDRLANAVAAQKKFPGKNVLVIDAGTCIKYDVVNSKSEYLGGAISPGLTMRFKALNNYTARLPLLATEELMQAEKIPLSGDSTTHSILSGVGNGALKEVDGIIDEYENIYSDLTIILTGGDAPFFENHLKRKIFALPNLVLMGLNIILNYNLKQD